MVVVGKSETEEVVVEPTDLCPNCGTKMIEEDGVLICPSCDTNIDYFGDDADED